MLPSNIPSNSPSSKPSLLPSSEPSWLDDEQCSKKNPENDVCADLDGRCKLDCEDDENYICVPGLCTYNRDWDKPTKSPKMRTLIEDEVAVIEVSTTGQTDRKLKSPKGSKATKAKKAPKSTCECRVPRRTNSN